MVNKCKRIIGLFLIWSICSTANGDVVNLFVPMIQDSPTLDLYFHELLKTAIIQAGHEANFKIIKSPQSRVSRLLDTGAISIYWRVESAERNQKYVPIEVDTTSGLIGKRILFIKKGDQHLYDGVSSLNDFRKLKLVGGMGANWFDVKVWKVNQLPYKEQAGNWKYIFKKVALGRDFNYFSRGVNEILVESKQYPDLAIEQKLALIYNRDFRFYLSKNGQHAGAPYKTILDDALKKAETKGLIQSLVRKYWENDFRTLNFDQRIKLKLVTPK